jgi:hypothetical protein
MLATPMPVSNFVADAVKARVTKDNRHVGYPAPETRVFPRLERKLLELNLVIFWRTGVIQAA